jgi:hypothetical protein
LLTILWLDELFMICSYSMLPPLEIPMNNRVNEIRKVIRALRVSMLEAEAAMRDQVAHDRDCTFVAEELLKMRTVMAGFVREKESLGDREPILVNRHFGARPAPKPPFTRPMPQQRVG